jgi:uncharacterized cupin superfamily protein
LTNNDMISHSRIPLEASKVPPRTKATNYPAPFAARVSGRQKRALGDAFGLSRFGVNLTTLVPGAQSALLHRHSHQEEFVYILRGSPTLRTDEGEFTLSPGMCIGFVANGLAHHLVNRTDEEVAYLEIGDRDPKDRGEYPEDDLKAAYSDAGWVFTHKDGTPW